MKDLASPEEAIRAAATAYCVALHEADAATLERLCHDRFQMTWVGADGAARFLDKAGFVARVGGREAFEGAPVYEILEVDAEAPEMGRVKLSVTVPPRRFTDYLGFFCEDGEWRLIQKLFRVADGPAMEA